MVNDYREGGGMKTDRENQSTEKTSPAATPSTKDLTKSDLELNLGCCSVMLVTCCLDCGMGF
jgi:hypothetical protein